ncbi:MAG: Uma2 family endonuclease [Bacteroidota bacterium]
MRIPLNLTVVEPFTNDQLYEFCIANKELRIERDAHGQLFIMSPTGTETSFYNYDIGFELGIWNRKHKLGRISESNGGYLLPDGSMRAPDIAWISHERLKEVDPKDAKGFMKICPDFVIELMSPNDSLQEADKKMDNWLSNGVRLGWLIDPQNRLTYVCLPSETRHEISFTQVLSGGEVLPEFELDLQEIFGEKVS